MVLLSTREAAFSNKICWKQTLHVIQRCALSRLETHFPSAANPDGITWPGENQSPQRIIKPKDPKPKHALNYLEWTQQNELGESYDHRMYPMIIGRCIP